MGARRSHPGQPRTNPGGSQSQLLAPVQNASVRPAQEEASLLDRLPVEPAVGAAGSAVVRVKFCHRQEASSLHDTTISRRFDAYDTLADVSAWVHAKSVTHAIENGQPDGYTLQLVDRNSGIPPRPFTADDHRVTLQALGL